MFLNEKAAVNNKSDRYAKIGVSKFTATNMVHHTWN